MSILNLIGFTKSFPKESNLLGVNCLCEGKASNGPGSISLKLGPEIIKLLYGTKCGTTVNGCTE